jgi:hypothetical protein
VSTSLAPSNPPPTGTLESIAGSYNLIWGYDACDSSQPPDPWKLYNPSAPPFVNDLEEMTAQGGYWLDMTTSASWQVPGLRSAATTFTLCPGWNLIGYPARDNRPPAEVLTGIVGKYNLVYGYDAADTVDPWKKYNPTGPPYANDLTEMRPGFGYWVRMTEAATLTIVSR